ncbi:MAG: MarR family transcriptional regulator [Anaerolineae bacterium]|nr:MarR family transcriptional regulator [Anaerolineae bacterium]
MAHIETLYTLIKDIFFLLDDGDQQLFSRYDLTGSRYYILYHLGDQPGLSVSQLSSIMFCDKSNITRLVRAMEEEGLVSRQPHESDGRSLRLFLTDQGAALRAEVSSAHLRLNQERFGRGLPEIDQGDLLSCLQQLKVSLERDLGHTVV